MGFLRYVSARDASKGSYYPTCFSNTLYYLEICERWHGKKAHCPPFCLSLFGSTPFTSRVMHMLWSVDDTMLLNTN